MLARLSLSRLLKKAHLRRWRARAALRRTDQVRLAPGTQSGGCPSCGWVPGAPPCIWTFLSSLGVNEFFSILLVLLCHKRSGREPFAPQAGQ